MVSCEKYHATEAASSYLAERHGVKVAPATLDSWRSRGRGPVFHKIAGKVLYSPAALDAWVQAEAERSRSGGAVCTTVGGQVGG